MSFAQLLQPGEENWRDLYLENCTAKIATIGTLNATTTTISDISCNTITVGGNLMCDQSRNLTLGAGTITTTGNLTLGTGTITTTGDSTFGKVNTNTVQASLTLGTAGDAYTGSGLTPSETVTAVQEYGGRFYPPVDVCVTALKVYRTTNMASSRTLRLWDANGTLLATATTSAEVIGSWNTSGELSVKSLILTANTWYTISYTSAGYTSRFIATPYPYTGTTGWQMGAVGTNVTPGGYPTPGFSGTQGLAVDFVAYPTATCPLSLMGGQSTGTGSLSGSEGGIPRILFGNFRPAPSTVTQLTGSYGFSAATYNSTGQFTFTFEKAFKYVPTVTATIIVPDNLTLNAKHIVYTSELTRSSVKIYTIEPGVAWVNKDFSITVIGI